MAEQEPVLFDVQDRVATITLNRPSRGNALNPQMRDDLRAAWIRAKSDPEIWVVIVTGAGSAFSTGADVAGLHGGAFRRQDRWTDLAMIERIRVLPTPRRLHVQKPVIAAVNGAVAGVSLDLVTEADIPIASEQASFFDPHVSIGYVSSHEMVSMARRIPVSVCLRMALLGDQEHMNAKRAYEVGLVTEVVPHDRLMERARELAGMLLKNAPLAVWGTKMGILQGLGLPIPQAEEIAAGYLEIVEQTDDHQEGPRAFVKKRAPVWKAG